MFLIASADRAPEVSALNEVQGKVDTVKLGLAGRSSPPIRFRLDSTERHFVYLAKGGAADRVFVSLKGAGQREVSILYDPQEPHSPPFDDGDYYTVYSVKIDSKEIRSYDEVVATWNADSRLGLWAGAGCIGLGLCLGAVSLFRDAA